MTREQAKDFLIKLGIEEPSKEQVDNYLNQLQGETSKYNAKVEQGKKDAELVDELRSKLETIENQNLSDIEKANKEKEQATKELDALKAQVKAMELKTSLADKGINGEDAENLIKGLIDGTGLDVDLLGQIIANKEAAAATKKEQDIANGSTNPGGGSNGDNEAEKTPAEEVAETVAKSLGGDSKASNDVVSSYF